MYTGYSEPYGPSEQAKSSGLPLAIGFVSFLVMLPAALMVVVALAI